ncbi:MAG: hypothetical protein AAFW81_06100 [Pseudomonadota bacterium]
MGKASTIRSIFMAGSATLLLAACTQGEEIESPGSSGSGTPPGGGGGGGGGGVSMDTCPTGLSQSGTVGGGATQQVVCDIAGTIISDLTLPFKDDDNDGIPVAYRINGRVNIGVDVGFDGTASGAAPATLTIEPGVFVFGESGNDFIVVNRGSKIEAAGTQSRPIIFTSRADLDSAPTDDRTNSIGEWGGLVILGLAPINDCATGTLNTASCNNIIEGVTAPEASYGGGDAADDSGTLRYVQVRFAGFPLAAGDELNGISFGGVGTGTEVDFVQVHNNSDDGIEMFGGTVNLRHIVLTGNDDDSLDTDQGWNGNLQFLIVSQTDGRGDNGFEMSSAGLGTSDDTDPTIANFTIVGSTRDRLSPGNAIRLNSGHRGTFLNGVVTDVDACFRWQQSAGNGDTTFDAGVDPTFLSVIFDCDGGLARAAVTGSADPDDDEPDNLTGVPADMVADDAPASAEKMSTITSNFQSGTMEETPMAMPADLTTVDPFFEDTDYLGAFGPDETETNNWASGWTFNLFTDPGCPAGTTNTNTTIAGKNVCELDGVITTDLTLTRNNHYEIAGRVDVGVDVGSTGAPSGAALRIEPGTTLFGNSGADFIVVNRGAQIFSNGTRSNPVIMTSEDDLELEGIVPPPSRLDAIGEWGGLVVLGQAPINDCATGTLGMADCNNIIEGVTAPEASYGGGDAADDSGSIMFTRVMFAGFPLAAGDELNGISFGGAGSGTDVQYVQVHNNSDDGIEMFGGTTNLKYIVLTGNDDDSLDTDQGWNGNVQFLIVAQRSGRGDNGFEMSSAGLGTTADTDPTIANFTIAATTRDRLSPGNGIRLNSGHRGNFINGVITDIDHCFRWQQSAGNGDTTFDSGIDPTFVNSLFDCDAGLARAAITGSSDPDDDEPDNLTAVPAAMLAAGAENTDSVSVSLINGFINDGAINGRTAFTDLNTNVDAFFENTTYIGAVENAMDDWWAEWSCGLEEDDC